MRILEDEITISDLYKNYEDNGENGIFAYNGYLSVNLFMMMLSRKKL